MDNPRHRQTLEVAFGDTDASGWVHFPNIFKYAELAEHAFLRSLGIVVFDRNEGGWPRVKACGDFKKPMMTGDRIEVLLDVSRVGGASVTWDFEILKDQEIAAFGSMTTVRVGNDGRPKILSDEERSKLDQDFKPQMNADERE